MPATDFAVRRPSLLPTFAGAALLLAAALPARADTFNGVSIRILSSVAPPGGSLQLLVTLTEAKPIFTGGPSMSFGTSLFVQGLVLPGNPDAAGAAVVDGHGGVRLRVKSPSATLGLSIAAPIIAVTLGVPANTPIGTQGSLTLDPLASWWIDPAGQAYPQQVRQGSFWIAPGPSIVDVVPGGGSLPAGSIVSVLGLGFQPGAIVEVDGVPVASTTFVDASHLDVVLGAAAQLDGRRVRVKNPDTTRASYYSYLRARNLGASTRPLLAATEPIFPVQPLSGAIFAAPAPAPGTFFALALQNPQPDPSSVAIELRSDAGAIVASTSFTLPARTEISREISELLSGVGAPAGSTVVVRATPAVQVLGLAADESASSVEPLLPALSFP
jgi:hypothetical protein